MNLSTNLTESSAVLLCQERALAGGGKLAVLTLNRASSLNALDLPMVTALLDKVQQWYADPSVRALFIDSTLDKAFCAGGDVRAMRDSALARSAADQPCVEAEAFFAAEYRLDYLLHRFGRPVIVWGNGIVMGGGLGIFAAGSHRIVTATTRIAMPEITIALFPDVGAGYFLPRMPGKTGLFCALTAARLNACDALYAGLATHRLMHSQKTLVLEALSALPLSVDCNEPIDNPAVTELLNQFSVNNTELQPESVLQSQQALIDACCAAEEPQVIVNRIIACTADSDWWRDCQANLQTGSPLTAAVIFRQLQMSASMSLAEVFRLDYLLATNIVRHPEFAEGVRALLVDKDRQPRWLYASVDQVPDTLLNALFTAPWPVNPLASLDNYL